MTIQKAYETIKHNYPDKVVVECLEFADFFAFALTDKGAENESAGGGYNIINKDSGEIGTFSPVQDLEAFFAAKRLDVRTLN